MSIYGLIGLLVAFAGVAVSVVCFLAGHFLGKRNASFAETMSWSGHIAVLLSTIALTFCCGLLVYGFLTGDTSIQYVVQNQSDSTSSIAWFYKLSGLWGGREGSLLFWAWLISVFNAVIAVRNLKKLEKLDNMALFVSQLVLAAFVGVLLFSESNMPFTAMAAQYFDQSGNLTGAAKLWGMNALLEHWAMAIHPPTLFIGYAGMTVPFAYAIAALIVNDPSKAWVEKSSRYTIFSWLFLGIGIGLGAVWAYVVLGWGGYWGWDPVENASLLPWLVGVALIHSFTVYKQRGAFKRWSVMCACFAFAFVILGTFITRSGLVESVHAFAGDPVSLFLFLALIIAAIFFGIVGLVIRWKSFAADTQGGDDFDSLMSKDAAYYINNLIMMIAAILLAYMTISSALPTWLPFGGHSLSAGTYNTIARPLGIIYLLILAVCPLLGWGKTQGAQFWKRARIPGILALVMFAGLMVYFLTYLLPSYNDIIAAGGIEAEGLLEQGAPLYYNGLTIVGFLVASLLFFNSLFMLGRGIGRLAKSKETNVFVAAFTAFKNHASTYGGFLAHFAMSIILVGLIGSSMYVTEKVDYVMYDEESDTAQNDFTIKEYTLKYTGNEIDASENGTDIFYTVKFDVFKNDRFVGAVEPTVQVVATTQQQKLIAEVISFPSEDLFVVYRGVDEDGNFAIDARVNPLISLVWVGFGLLMIGALISTIGRRKSSLSSPEDVADSGAIIPQSEKKKNQMRENIAKVKPLGDSAEADATDKEVSEGKASDEEALDEETSRKDSEDEKAVNGDAEDEKAPDEDSAEKTEGK